MRAERRFLSREGPLKRHCLWPSKTWNLVHNTPQRCHLCSEAYFYVLRSFLGLLLPAFWDSKKPIQGSCRQLRTRCSLLISPLMQGSKFCSRFRDVICDLRNYAYYYFPFVILSGSIPHPGGIGYFIHSQSVRKEIRVAFWQAYSTKCKEIQAREMRFLCRLAPLSGRSAAVLV